MKETGTEIKMTHNVLCSKDIFQNAVREARANAKADQARAVRDTVKKSTIWTSEVHIDADNVFVEAFFVNSVLLAKRLKVEFVYVDDTSCSNDFYLPVISVLCRDMTNTVHAVAWGVLKNRTTETFTRFFSFVARHFPSITTFMCDRHYAQRKSITLAFGDTVHIFHCCVHIARNIANNMGQNTQLTKHFWEMRYARTGESETKFMETLNRVHNAKRSSFTAHLINSIDSFLPSKMDPVIKKSIFPELARFSAMDLKGPFGEDQHTKRALDVIDVLRCVGVVEPDVFSLDNTNTVEGYFSMIKRRLAHTTKTLIDLYNAVNYSEELALASHDPSQPVLPDKLTQGLSFVLSLEVQRVMTIDGVRHFLKALAAVCERILRGVFPPEDETEKIVYDAIVNGAVIHGFRWMPSGWVISLEEPQLSHNVLHLDTVEELCAVNFLMRLETFMSVANRNIEVFNALNECLMTLYSVTNDNVGHNVVPATYSFFRAEFAHYAALSETNDEVARILSETCDSLETSAVSRRREDVASCRKSIVDPVTIKARGQRTTATSSNVDRTAARPRTKMTDTFQVEVLGRTKKSPVRTTRRHICPICLNAGHHAQTCSDALLLGNTQRLNCYMKKLFDRGKLVCYLASFAKRASPADVQSMIARVKSFDFLPEGIAASLVQVMENNS